MKKRLATSLLFYVVATIVVLVLVEPFHVALFVIGILFLSLFLSVSLEQSAEQRTKALQTKLNNVLTPMRLDESGSVDFEALSQLLDSAMILIDQHGIIVQVNPLFNEYFALNVSPGSPYEKLKKIKPLFEAISSSFITKKRGRTQIVHDERHYDISVTPVFEQEKFTGFLLFIHDINRLKTAETFQKQFTADVSHELKTPLTTIKGLAEILNHNPTMPEKEKADFIKLIDTEAGRMETILADLLTISKMDRLDYELKLETNDIKGLLENVLDLLEPEVKKKGLFIRSNIEPAELEIDETKIKQVIINLIKNALNYTDEGGLTVNGTKVAGGYRIDVIDTGIGIERLEQDKIFKRFYRSDEARSRASGGSGLGLSIIKNVVKKHQGSIGLTSEVGIGSHFKIFLPDTQKTPLLEAD